MGFFGYSWLVGVYFVRVLFCYQLLLQQTAHDSGHGSQNSPGSATQRAEGLWPCCGACEAAGTGTSGHTELGTALLLEEPVPPDKGLQTVLSA